MKGGARFALTESELIVGLRLVGKGTAEQIGNAIVRGRKSCLAMLQDMERRGVVHICGWLPTPGETPAIYTLGKGSPAPKPSRAESYRLWEQQNPEEAEKQRRRRSESMKRVKRVQAGLREIQFLSTDQRPQLERWACPDLSTLPRSIYLAGQA